MKRRWQIFWHAFFWVFIISFCLAITRNNTKLTINDLLIIIVLYGVINISLFYLNYLVFIPRLLDKKRYGLFALAIIIALIVYGLGKYGVAIFFRQYMIIHVKAKAVSFVSYFLSTVFTSLSFLFFSTILKFSVDWFLNERIRRDLENQRLSAELAFLKSQINPHFLFNSLNSIYSLAYQRSETTPEAILKLSEIMRYMLYECNDNRVELSKELQYVQNYIDLQKIRFGKKAFIDYKIEGKVASQQIVPLILIAFVENAFKHGVASTQQTPICILIEVDEEHLRFFIQNKKNTNNRDEAGGIGLNNVKRRLDLLYPGKYNLEISDETDTYTVELSLIL